MSSGRIGYLCTYTPGELIEAMGLVPYRFLPPPAREGAVDDLLDSNLCPYVRQIAGGLKNNCYPELEGIVIARSCEAALHLYNVFSEQAGCPVFLLDLPRKRNPASLNYFTRCLEELESWLQSLGGKLDHLLLQDKMEEYRETARLVDDSRNRVRGLDLFHLIGEYNGRPRGELNKALQQWIGTGEKVEKQVEEVLLLTGALPQQNLVNILEEERVILDCCQGWRGFMRGPESEEKEIFSRLASEYLQRPACPRFLDGEDRLLFLRDLLIRNRIKGVIYHDLGFCDLTGYDYLLLKSFFQENNIPLLKLKTELGAGEIGQILTRVEAFLETIGEEVGP